MKAMKNRLPKPGSFTFSSVAKIGPRNRCLPPYGMRCNQSASNRLAKPLPPPRVEAAREAWASVGLRHICRLRAVSRFGINARHFVVDRLGVFLIEDYGRYTRAANGPVLSSGLKDKSSSRSSAFPQAVRSRTRQSKTPVGYEIHRGEQNWMIDPEQLCDRRGDRHSRVDWYLIFSSNNQGSLTNLSGFSTGIVDRPFRKKIGLPLKSCGIARPSRAAWAKPTKKPGIHIQQIVYRLQRRGSL